MWHMQHRSPIALINVIHYKLHVIWYLWWDSRDLRDGSSFSLIIALMRIKALKLAVYPLLVGSFIHIHEDLRIWGLSAPQCGRIQDLSSFLSLEVDEISTACLAVYRRDPFDSALGSNAFLKRKFGTAKYSRLVKAQQVPAWNWSPISKDFSGKSVLFCCMCVNKAPVSLP